MRRFISFAIMALMVAGCSESPRVRLNQEGKADLRILYVGGQSDYSSTDHTVSKADLDASVAARMASFEEFLNERFTSVTVVKGEDYTPDMSEECDVTVFDGRTPVMEPGYRGYDSEGVMQYRSATRLPYDFDRACVMVGSVSEDLAMPIGVKHDWYCLCLDADAHNWVEGHQIFKGPFPVKLTTVMKATPENAYHYTYFYDFELPDSTLMWRVQKNGYMDTPGTPVGMVSRPWGYLDSPDCEYISSGVCAKTIDAVAIGRQGNFMHWGFAVSPDGLTDEGKAVFANAIVYMSRFNGQGILARKPNERVATREYLKERKYYATRECYENRIKSDEEFARESMALRDSARAKMARREELTRRESYFVDYEPQPPMTLEDFLKRYQHEVFDEFGTDLEAYQKYYDDNKPYFYGGKGAYEISVDEDCKAWGIANNEVKLLDKAISCLENGSETDRARRVLDRYTLCTFSTPQEWRSWYDTYHKKMFFTESGGWVFLIDGPSDLPGNDYRAKKAAIKAAEEAKYDGQGVLGEASQDVPVCVAANIVEEDGGTFVEVSFAICPGFHLYSTVDPTDPYVAMSIETSKLEGIEVGEPILPAARIMDKPGTTVFDSNFKVRIPVTVRENGPLTVNVGYQACDSKSCTIPAEREFKFMLKKK